MALKVQGVTTLLEIFDVPKAVAFSRDVLGFEVVGTSQPSDDFNWALLKLGDAELMLNTAYEDHEWPPATDPARIAAHADTKLFFGCPDVDAACTHFQAKGVNVGEPIIRDYGMKQLWLTDPDGFRLCFQWPAA